MKLINPEDTYENEITGKIRPIIQECNLSDTTRDWFIETIATQYNDSEDSAIRIATYCKFISTGSDIQENFLPFILFCYAKGWISDPNTPFPISEHFAEILFTRVQAEKQVDFTRFFANLMRQQKEDSHSSSTRTINTFEIAVFLLLRNLLEYESIIDLATIPKAFYSLFSEGKQWDENDYTIGSEVHYTLTSWGAWLQALQKGLPSATFDSTFYKVDNKFYNHYFLKAPIQERFLLGEHYVTTLFGIVGYPPNRHVQAPSFEWLFEKGEPYFLHLIDQYNTIPYSDENLKVLLRLAHFTYRCHPEKLQEGMKAELLLLSQQAIGNYRSSLKSIQGDKNEHLRGIGLVNEAINFICYFDNPSKALIHLVQLLRFINWPSVNNDLSFHLPKRSTVPFGLPIANRQYLDEDPLPQRAWFVEKIEWVIVCFYELRNNAIQSTRETLSRFFGARLKTKKGIKTSSPKNEELVEPDPVWRQGYISCIRALHCNPEGKLHHTLFFSRNGDPDKDVRKEATKAYKEIRHDNPLPSKMEEILTLYRAFWFLRQAHFVSLLGIDQLDVRGSQRTYSKEVDQCKTRMKSK